MRVGMRAAAWIALVAVLTLTVLPPGRTLAAAPESAARRLRGSEALARAYDTILNNRVDLLEAELAQACPPAPAEACQLLRVTGTWWRIQADPHSRALDAAFARDVEAAIGAAEAWTRRSPGEAEAWFYLGAAYALRVQFRVLRDEKLSAARDGKRIKQALDRAVALDPRLNDAYFGIGLYQYYADVAPAALRFLRWLLLLPGGNRTEGLQRMLKAQTSGEVLRGEAEYQLHIIYLWYERRPDRAIAVLERLRGRYPQNALFPLLIAEIRDTYFHDPTAALDTYAGVLAAAREREVADAKMAETRARLGMARQLDLLVETDRAIDHLKAVLDLRPEAPYSAKALAALRLAAAYDRMGQRDLASAAYRSAIAAAPADDPLGIVSQARDGLAQRSDVRLTEAYRVSLDGWRALERDDLTHAESSLRRALDLRAEDPVTQYRWGKLLQARGDDEHAITAFDHAIRLRISCPPTILGAAFLEAGRLHERAGRRDRAAAMYRGASRVFGASSETRSTAQRLLARLTASNPNGAITRSTRRP